MSKIKPLSDSFMSTEGRRVSKGLLAAAIVCLCSVPVFASTNVVRDTELTANAAPQSVIVKGKVVDTKGMPVIQASVLESGTTRGTVTDLDGTFELNVSSNASVLEVSCIGYASISVNLNNIRNLKDLTITLEEDSQSLEETVVVGYATQKKANLTGSVSTVDVQKDIVGRTSPNISNLLAGTASGVRSVQGSGQPGVSGSTIIVRGQGTLNSYGPLVVVDGIISSMDDVNPVDVESISVLKDAASSAIYGSRAANGVILITTKKGRAGTAKISYDGYVSLENVYKSFDIVSNYADYMEIYNESMYNTGLPSKYSAANINEWRKDAGKNPLKYPNTDWQKDLFRTGVSQNHTVSIQGGSDNIRYFASINFYKNPGTIRWSDFQKWSGRVNFEADINKYITAGVNVSGSYSEMDPNAPEISGGDFFSYGAWKTTPGIVYESPDGRFGGYNNQEDASDQNANPYRRINFWQHNLPITNETWTPKAYLKISPLKGLSIEGSYTFGVTHKRETDKLQDFPLWNFRTEVMTSGGAIREQHSEYVWNWKSHMAEVIARYNHDFGNLRFGAIAGASQEDSFYEYMRATGLDSVDHGLDVLDAAATPYRTNGNNSKWQMRSYFARLNFEYMGKYLLEANLRADGSSRFSKDNRWGYFPSFSAGWVMSNEKFFPQTNWIDFLKLRGSYGTLGNNSVGNYAYQTLYSASNAVIGNGATTGGFAQTSLANANITWEKTAVTNVGIDFTLLGGKLSGSAEFFNKRTTGILINLPASIENGIVGIPAENAATVRNNGFEMNLGYKNHIGKFEYYVNGNISYVKNKVVKFKGKDVPSISGNWWTCEGDPINMLYIMKVDRLVQTDADMAYVQSLVDKNPNYFSTFKRPMKGDYLYADTDGDGSLNYNDRKKYGNGYNPTFTYGITLGGSWKGIDVSMIFNGTGEQKDILMNQMWQYATSYRYTMDKKIMDGRWFEGRTTPAKYPRLLDRATDGRNCIASDAYMFDRSYFRMKNLTIGYTVPEKITNKFFASKVRVYASGDNLFTVTDWPGFDPEVGSGNCYPISRVFSFGINLTF